MVDQERRDIRVSGWYYDDYRDWIITTGHGETSGLSLLGRFTAEAAFDNGSRHFEVLLSDLLSSSEYEIARLVTEGRIEEALSEAAVLKALQARRKGMYGVDEAQHSFRQQSEPVPVVPIVPIDTASLDSPDIPVGI